MPRALFFDLDGTLYQGDRVIDRAPAALAAIRAAGIPCRFLTNTTSRPRSAVVARLRGFGFTVEPSEVFTALAAGAELARTLGVRRLLPLVTPAALEDLAEFELVGGTSGTELGPEPPDAVLVGDMGRLWSFDLMQQGFTALRGGARLIACSKDRCSRLAGGITLDCGPFVVALEYAAETEALLAGKPNPAFYAGAVKSLGLPAAVPRRDIVMIGDDLRSDVQGAQQAGLQGWLVRTGTYSPSLFETTGIHPDRVLESVADLADSGALLG